MISLVVDTNVLISALIGRPGTPPDRILRAWRDGLVELIISPKLMAELRDVLGRPRFVRSTEESRAFVDALVLAGRSAPDPEEVPAVTPDPDDDYLVALDLATDAQAIVSGDRHLLNPGLPVPVLTPRQLVDRLG